jgi:hypothetical protein
MRMEESKTAENQGPAMHHREITLADGRYMIFYTFDGPPPTSPPADADEPNRAKRTDV